MWRQALARTLLLLGLLLLSTETEGVAMGAELLVGAASADITPAGPVAVSGQFNLRIARTGGNAADGQRARPGIARGRAGRSTRPSWSRAT